MRRLGFILLSLLPYTQFGQNLLPIETRDGWGYINYQDELAIEPKYSWAGEFVQQSAIVLENGYFHFIDSTGQRINSEKYLYAVRLQDGGAKIYNEQFEWINLDSNLSIIRNEAPATQFYLPKVDSLEYGYRIVRDSVNTEHLFWNDTELYEGNRIEPILLDSQLCAFYYNYQLWFYKADSLVYRIDGSDYDRIMLQSEIRLVDLTRIIQLSLFDGSQCISIPSIDTSSLQIPTYAVLDEHRHILFLAPINYVIQSFGNDHQTTTAKLNLRYFQNNRNPNQWYTISPSGLNNVNSFYTLHQTRVGLCRRNGTITWLPDSLDNISTWYGDFCLVRIDGDNSRWFPIDSSGNRIGNHFIEINGLSGFGCTVSQDELLSRETGYWGKGTLPENALYFDTEKKQFFCLTKYFARDYGHEDAVKAQSDYHYRNSLPQHPNHAVYMRGNMTLSVWKKPTYSRYNYIETIPIRNVVYPIYSSRNCSPLVDISKPPEQWMENWNRGELNWNDLRVHDFYVNRNNNRIEYLYDSQYLSAQISREGIITVDKTNGWGYVLPSGRKIGFRYTYRAYSSNPAPGYLKSCNLSIRTQLGSRRYSIHNPPTKTITWLISEGLHLNIRSSLYDDIVTLNLTNNHDRDVSGFTVTTQFQDSTGEWQDIHEEVHSSLDLTPRTTVDIAQFDPFLGDIQVNYRFKVSYHMPTMGAQRLTIFSDDFEGTILPIYYLTSLKYDVGASISTCD